MVHKMKVPSYDESKPLLRSLPLDPRQDQGRTRRWPKPPNRGGFDVVTVALRHGQMMRTTAAATAPASASMLSTKLTMAPVVQ